MSQVTGVEFWRNRRRQTHELMQSYRAQIRRGRLSGNRREECDGWHLLSHCLQFCRMLKKQEEQAARIGLTGPDYSRPVVCDLFWDGSGSPEPDGYDDSPPPYVEDMEEWDRHEPYLNKSREVAFLECEHCAASDLG